MQILPNNQFLPSRGYTEVSKLIPNMWVWWSTFANYLARKINILINWVENCVNKAILFPKHEPVSLHG